MTFFSLNTYVPLGQEVYYSLSYQVIHSWSQWKKKVGKRKLRFCICGRTSVKKACDTTYLQYYPNAAEIRITESKLWWAAAGFATGNLQQDIRNILEVSFSFVAPTPVLIISTPLTRLLWGGGPDGKLTFYM